MKEGPTTIDFFLGSNSEHGFVSHFEQLQNPNGDIYTYIIKGGPGTGKSRLMKKVAETLNTEGSLEYIHCSSDPDSLDGLICKEKGVAFVDGTPPHTLEPRFPLVGAKIINLLSCADSHKIKPHKDAIVSMSTIISAYHKRFCELLSCANMLLDKNRQMIAPFIDFSKIHKLAERIIKKELKPQTKTSSKEHVRMLSAFTPKGLVTYQKTISSLCRNVWFIHDDYRVCAPTLLAYLRSALLSGGYEFYTCYSPFRPDIEIDALLVPQLDLAFVTTDRYVSLDTLKPTKVINATRFIETEIFRIKKQRLSFYRKTANEVLTEAIEMLLNAKNAHDELEEFYTTAMDFKKLNEKSSDWLSELT